MKKWYSKAFDHWDDAIIYTFTVLCVFLGDYILHKTRPEVGWLPFLASLVVAVLICLIVEVMQSRPDTEEKRIAKKKALARRVLLSGLAGMASQAVIPVVLKTLMASVGVDL